MSYTLGMSSSLLWPRPLKECLDLLADAGFTRVEIAPDHIFRDLVSTRAAQEIAVHAQAGGLSIETLHLPYGDDYDFARASEGGFQQARAHLLQLAEVAHLLEARALVWHPSDTERNRLPSVPEALLRVRRRMETLLPTCEGLGLRLALEHVLPHLLGGRVDELRALVDPVSSPCLCFCLDVSHASFAGGEVAAIGALADRLAYVHASDNLGHRDDHLLPGRGRLAWSEITTALARADFSGVVVVEPAPSEAAVALLAEVYRRMATLLHPVGYPPP